MKRLIYSLLLGSAVAVAAPSSTRQLTGANILNGLATITLPTTTGTLCGITEACSLTAKTAIGINDSGTTSALYVKTSAIGVPTATFKAIGSQSADIIQVLDSASSPQFIFDAGGNFKLFHNTVTPEARFDLRPSVSATSVSSGSAARYGMYVGNATAVASGVGSGIALGGPATGSTDLTEYAYLWATKNNAVSGDVDTTFHIATRRNSDGKAQRVVDMDQAGNSVFVGTVTAPTMVGSTSALFGNSGTPATSAALEVNSTSKALLLPRMSQTQRDAIGSPTNGDVVFNTDTLKVSLHDGSSWADLGSGSGSGVKNYLTDGTFDSSVNPESQYDDGASYVDGTAGSPSAISYSRDSSTPLAGTGSLKISKAASTCVGEGVTLGTTSLDEYAAARGSLNFYFQYDFTSANYTSGDIQIKAYDVTNGAILPVVAISGLDSSAGLYKLATKGFVRVLVSSTTRSVRLSFHCQTDSATASTWTGRVDEAVFGPDGMVPGFIGTDWNNNYTFTPASAAFGTASPSIWWSRRVGDSLEVIGYWTNGTVGASAASLAMPATLTINTAKMGSGTNSTQVGTYFTSTTSATPSAYGAGSNFGAIFYDGSTNGSLFFAARGVSVGFEKTVASPTLTGTGFQMSVHFTIPITGWSTSAALSTTETLASTSSWAGYHDNTCQWPRTNTSYGDPTADASCALVERTNRNFGTVSTSGGVLPAITFTPTKKARFHVCATAKVSSSTLAADMNLKLWDGTTVIAEAEAYEYVASNLIHIPICGEYTTTSLSPVTLSLQTKSTAGAVNIGSNAANASSLEWSIEEIPDFSNFSVYGNFELLTTTSGSKTPSATNNYHALTTNSLTLTAGTWRLFGSGNFSNGGTTPAYANAGLLWASANGADSSSVPAALSSTTGLTVLSVDNSNNKSSYGSAGMADPPLIPAPMTIVRCSSSCTVYLVSYATMTTAANARITVYANAERLQ
jgi:hypothetical protein